MSVVIEEIKFKLEQLKTKDTDYIVFGASAHGYVLNSIVESETIEGFEEYYNCRLPSVYKDFMMDMGNGGAGPSYGLFPLGRIDYGYDFALWPENFVFPDKPFKFSDAFNDTSVLTRGAPEASDFESKAEYETAYHEWRERNYRRLHAEYELLHSLDGAIPICNHGCGYRSWMVVSEGSEHGSIWYNDTPDAGGVYPETTGKKSRIDFGEWYLGWLDKSIKEITE